MNCLNKYVFVLQMNNLKKLYLPLTKLNNNKNNALNRLVIQTQKKNILNNLFRKYSYVIAFSLHFFSTQFFLPFL